MRQARMAVLLACAVASAAVEAEDRTGEVLTAAQPSQLDELFPLGYIRYFVVTNSTSSPGTPPLDGDDQRIAGAVVEWESATCLRFERCESEEECELPFLRFISHASSCSSYVGARLRYPNRINLADWCGPLSVAHEIGHAIGLKHEQSRKDRDKHVTVNLDRVREGAENNFRTMDESGRDLGAYNYASMMHYSSSGFTTGGNTIDAPQRIGQRTHLTKGDAEGVQFLYSYCQSELDAPLCIASVADDVTHIIPYTATWNVDFNMNYLAETAAVSYEETTAPAGAVTYKYAAGTVLGNLTYTNVTFTPTIAEAGKTFVLGATFTGANGEATSCSVQVAVSDSEHVCFGIGSKNATVCSGRGRCVQSFPSLCECNEGYGGVDCSGLASCGKNEHFGFNESRELGYLILSDGLLVKLDTQMSAVGDSSLRVGEEGDATRTYMYHRPNMSPNKVTFFMSAMQINNMPLFDMRFNRSKCVEVAMTPSNRWLIQDFLTDATFARNHFYFVDIRMDWVADTVSVLIDGETVARDLAINPTCSGQEIDTLVFFGNGWIDELSLWCTHYVLMSGSLVGDVDEAVVRDGGATLTLSLVGTSDTWVNTDETKRAIIKALVSDAPVSQGWNALIGQAVDESLVTITDKQVVVGPLRAAPTYKSAGDELVNVVLSSGMFTSGQVPDQDARELFFRVRGSCHMPELFSFNTAVDMLNGTTLSAIAAAGAGALELETTEPVVLLGGTARPTFVRWFVSVEDADAQALVRFVSPSGTSMEVMFAAGYDAMQYRASADHTWSVVQGTAGTSGYHAVDVEFDWAARRYTLLLDGSTVGSGALDVGMLSVASTELQAQTLPVRFDEMTFGCGNRPPVFFVDVCPVPGQVGVTMEVHEGSQPLSKEDKVAIVPAGSTDCADAEWQCRVLGACSPTAGWLSEQAGKVHWMTGPLGRLQPEGEYKVCYYTAAKGRYELLESTLKTCATELCPWKKYMRNRGQGKGHSKCSMPVGPHAKLHRKRRPCNRNMKDQCPHCSL